MKDYVYSDPHFNHENIIKYANRPFKDVEQMNRFMIEEFNRVVSRKDRVFILGDFGFGSFDEIGRAHV